jgi:tetratricopeptide (TPR) repeat protein
MQTGIDAWKTCYELDTKGKYRDDIKGQVMMVAFQGNSMGGTMFGEQKFEEAFELFSSSVMMYDIIGGLEVKEYGAAAFNAGLSAERIEKHEYAYKFFSLSEQAGFEPAGSAAKAANALYNMGKTDEAMAYVVSASEKYPGDGGLIITMADLALKTGQDDLAIKSLTQAIAKEPKNGVYHWAIGTVYQRVNKEEDAMKSFLTASELDPKDERPFYSLGTFHFNKAVDLMEQANKLKLGDPQFEVLEKKAVDEFEKAAPYLEKVVELKGDEGNKDLLTNLFTIHRKLGNSAKALDFKKRADALK